jgi:hypothetical protein
LGNREGILKQGDRKGIFKQGDRKGRPYEWKPQQKASLYITIKEGKQGKLLLINFF